MDLAAQIQQAVQQVKRSLGTLVVQASLKSVTPGAYVNGVMTNTEASTPVYVVVTKYEFDELKGTSVVYSDLKVLVFNDGVEPTTKDKLLINGSLFEILNVDPTYAGSLPVIYTVQCRK